MFVPALNGLGANYLVCLWSFSTLDDVEFYLVAFFQGFVAVKLNGTVMYEDIWTAVVP